MKIVKKPIQNLFALLMAFFCLFEPVQAQIGINTKTPAATVHVKSVPNVKDGIIAPIVSLDNMTGYGSAQVGAIVYCDGTGTGDASTSIVTEPGYYYFDGISWQSFADTSTPSNDWQVGGNNNTNDEVFGTTSNTGILIRTNNLAAAIIDNNQQLSTTKDIVVNGVTVGVGSNNSAANTAVGANALGQTQNPNGSDNTGIGNNAGSRIAGHRSTYLGANAGRYNSGSNNIFVGASSGNQTANRTGDANIIIGSYAAQSMTGSGNVVLGSLDLPSGLNQTVTIGSGGGSSTAANGNEYLRMVPAKGADGASLTNTNAFVGINTSNPNHALDVEGSVSVSSLKTTNTINVDANNLVAVDNNGLLKAVPASGSFWQVGGNAALPAGNNVLGTTDAKGLQIQTNSSPRVTFDAAGNTIVEAAGDGDGHGSSGINSYLQIKQLAGLQGGLQLVVDSLGKVYVQSQVAKEKLIQYTTIRLDSVNRDYVSNFDTEISSDEYTVVVTSATFFPVSPAAGIKTLSQNGFTAVPVLQAYAFIQGNTWRIQCDYKDSSPSDNLDGSWNVSMVIMDNSIVNMIDPPGNPKVYLLNAQNGSVSTSGGGPIIH